MEYAWHVLPSYLAETKYQNPTNGLKTALQKGLRTDDAVFDWIYKRPDYLATFNVFMRTQREARANWLDYYPLDEDFKQLSKDKDAVAFVDIGGALGHEIEEVKRKHPNAPGRLILEDVPHNTDNVTSMEAVGHDFFTPQPIKGTFFSC